MNHDHVSVQLSRPGFDLDVTFELPPRGVLALLGPSGSGKSTVLRAVAGLEPLAEGRIRVAGQDWLNSVAGISLRPQRRRVGMVFQDYALFEHMRVAANIGFGVPRAQRARTVARLIDTFHLGGLADRYPRHLSGGQRQRVALARALAHQPDMLLLDEPLSAIDVHLRERLRGELVSLFSDLATPTLLVSHDLDEARQLADHVGILVAGRLHRIGTVREVFEYPGTVEAAQVLGWRNLLPVTHLEPRAIGGPWGRVKLLREPSLHTAALGIRPEKVSLLPPGEGGLLALVERITDRGAIHELQCRLQDGTPFHVQRLWSDALPQPGSRVGLGLPLQHLVPLAKGPAAPLPRLDLNQSEGAQPCPSAVAVS